MAKGSAKDKGESPRKLAARGMRSREGLDDDRKFESLVNNHQPRDANIEEEEEIQYEHGRADETDELLASLGPNPRTPAAKRDDTRVYRSVHSDCD